MEYLYSLGNSLEFLKEILRDACKRLNRQRKIYILMSIFSLLIGTIIIIVLIVKINISELGNSGSAFIALSGTFYTTFAFQSIQQAIAKGSLFKMGQDVLKSINKFGNLPDKIADLFVNFYSKLP